MDHSFLNKNIKKLVDQRNIFLLFSSVLSIVVILLSILLLTKRERTVIVPTNGTSYWIEENKASSGYIEKMGLFLSDLLLNRTPSDVEKRNRIILEYVDPSSYHTFRKLLLQEQEAILKNSQIFEFHSETSYVDAARAAFVLEGEATMMVSKKGSAAFCAQKSRKKYTLQFHCKNGKLYLTALKKEEA